MTRVLKVIIACLFYTSVALSEDLEIPLGSRKLVIRDRGTEGSDLCMIKGEEELIIGKRNFNFGSYKRTFNENGETSVEVFGDNKMEIQTRQISKDTFHITTHFTLAKAREFSTCFNLSSEPGDAWYGGPELKQQTYPINTLKYTNYAYVTKELNNAAISERYWLVSSGRYVYYDLRAPLFINQNVQANILCFNIKVADPFSSGTTYDFSETLGFGPNVKEVHEDAVANFLNKPTSIPDKEMIKHPIWSTWVKYGADINAEKVLKFANEINSNGFTNSQLEIDDKWETCYGSLTIDTNRFSDMKGLVTELKSMGFRVTLWVHPFINDDCDIFTLASENGYLVTDSTGKTMTTWWNSEKDKASHVDFTNPSAAEWFSDRLKALQESTGIDSFKFDAGETSWMPVNAALTGNIQYSPHLITQAYVREAAKFGAMVEVRSGQNTQDLPIFVRMVDKDSHWTINNGLKSLVTTLLQMNLAGYSFVIPDMIGGNAYNEKPPTKELFIRWLQANTFMPSLQYSIAPWDFDEETVLISKKFNALHLKYADFIELLFQRTVDHGEPVNPPIWWLSPTDAHALKVNDEYLLGDYILAAPILDENSTSRTIYLPAGRWMDGNDNDIITEGPTFIFDYPAPLDTLPFFINLDSRINGAAGVVASVAVVFTAIIISMMNFLQ